MKLNAKQLKTLIRMSLSARDDDTIGCDGCYELMEQFAQAELDGREVPDGLEAVRAHLDQCQCCRAEYEALMAGLREIVD